MRRAYTLVHLPQCKSVLHRCCSTQPQALPRDKLLEEVVELRVTKSVQDILHAEFKTLNAKIESSNTALNAKIESSNTALTNNFRQAMKDREGSFLIKVVAAVAGAVGLVEVFGYQIRINQKSA